MLVEQELCRKLVEIFREALPLSFWKEKARAGVT